MALGAVWMIAGCGSYWDLRQGEVLAVGCPDLLNYYLDVDGDGWGGSSGDPTPLCEPDIDNGLTAWNDLDCDDGDPDITGQVGAVCPEDLDPEGTPCVSGLVFGDSEFLVTCGASIPQRFTIAEGRCVGWAGTAIPGGTTGVEGHRGLASLAANFEQVEVLEEWLETLPEVRPGFAIFVDLRWEGSLEDGQWVWPSGEVPDEVPLCNGEATEVADFYPTLIPEDPAAQVTLEEHKDEVRLALVFDGSGWCRGTPDALEGVDYDHQSAHYLCERPRPNLAQYKDRP